MSAEITKHLIVVAPDDYSEDVDLGVLNITEEGIEWFVNKRTIYKATWEQWALQVTASGITV